MITGQHALCVPACADGCKSCTIAGECTTCNEGYVLKNDDKTCIGQFISIQSCVICHVSYWCIF